MNKLLHNLRTAPTFQYEGRNWVLFEEDSFQPIAGLTEVGTLGRMFACRTMVHVKVVIPSANPDPTPYGRRMAAAADMTRIMSACGDVLAWCDLGGDLPELVVTFADEVATSRALLQDGFQLREGALQVRPRVWPLDSTAIRRVEPDKMVKPPKPMSWISADNIRSSWGFAAEPQPELQYGPVMPDTLYTAWSPEDAVVPAPWVTAIPPLPFPSSPSLFAGSSTSATLEHGPLGPTLHANALHDAAIQKVIAECELPEGEELTPIPWPKVKFPPGFQWPEYKVPKIISDAQEIRHLKTEAMKKGATPAQLAWGRGHRGEGADYSARPARRITSIPLPPPAFDENGNPPPNEPIHGPDSPYYTWISRRPAPEPATADEATSAEGGLVPGPSGDQREDGDGSNRQA